MLDRIFAGVFDTDMTQRITVGAFLLCVLAAIALGVVLSLSHMYKNRYTKSFLVTLALLPAVVCVVIMMVNGNIGAGVAVAGAFSLVRFRSVPGTAQEITALFIAMGAGLVTGMGYIGFAALFTLALCAVSILWRRIDPGSGRGVLFRTLTVVIPEDLNYTEVFDSILSDYTERYELVRVKTTNMGSMFRLTYDLKLKHGISEKAMIDDIRCRNGNLEVSLARQETAVAEL